MWYFRITNWYKDYRLKRKIKESSFFGRIIALKIWTSILPTKLTKQ